MTTPRPTQAISRRALLLGGTAAAALTGCGLGTGGGFTRSGTLSGAISGIDLDGLEAAVGSKNFSEQVLVGKMAVILLKSAGADVQDLTNIPGSASSRQAMLQGEIQVMWEYTGTAWIAYLGETDPIPDEQEQYEAVRQRDLEENDLVWLSPAPMNNTYGFATPRAKAEELGVEALSDLQDLDSGELSFCVESEFNNRNDGMDPMLQTYDLQRGREVPEDQVKVLDTGAIYEATDQGLCNFGEIFTTDGRIKALDLVVLEDDREFFPKYNLCPVVTSTVIEEFPQIRDLFAPVSEALTDDVLIELNARIDVEGEEPGDVAWEWLTGEGLVSEAEAG
ncbi:glycine betaine ABC transporter substrate-binding protein [Marihabitans asiaticum]|uniref:Osmoprotectant transport system substrate-binding protein n=1 Tax=Marihabitans asiaticum TaxID=415218 RepID=A0A560WDF2_9MICO|nr:glycine betaine ABC transporter substrate-binding protein [Marihabitans asiaticum]TWD15699.1 osmoprotectant transport system substrate-binding protein [Marihabitans asiaticum]